jgi:predicted MFS family arabinose efflux permease
LPVDIVYRQVLRTVKNFAALFVASAFLAGLFLQFAGTMQRATRSGLPRNAQEGRGTALDLVKPVFFVAVFLEHLNYPFLSQFIYEVTTSSGFSPGFASAPFMAYYLFFALTLIPAGHFTQKFGARHMMFIGLLLAAGGLLSLGAAGDFYSVMLARAVAGIGQGMLFIGVQAYIFATASPEKKTQGAAIIVIGFQSGMISGTAIGSLLVGYLGPVGVFTLAGGLAVALAMYTLIFVPFHTPQPVDEQSQGNAWRALGRDLGLVLRSLDFLKTMMLIGVPAKAVMTGIIIFALPLLLSQMDYAHEDIGQVIMLYAIGVLVASIYISRYVDRTGKIDSILFWGTSISGIGLLLIGLVEWQPVAESAYGPTVVLIAGVIVIGIAHGFICAPVVTRIAETRIAESIGVNSVTSTYRFLERLGHIAGPIIVGQLFVFAGQTTTVVAWVGAGIVVLGLIFVLQMQPAQRDISEGLSS